MPHADLDLLVEEGRRRGRERPLASLIHLVLPFAIVFATVGALHLAGGLGRVSAAAATSFFTIGKLIVLSGAHPENPFRMSAVEFALMVVWMDAVLGYALAYNLHYVYRVRKLGPPLKALHDYCAYWLATSPWMRNWAFLAVAFFVFIPLTGTGAPGGSILGGLLGLRPRAAAAAVLSGSLASCGLLAAFAAPLEPLFRDLGEPWWFEAMGVAVLGIVVFWLYRLGRRVSRAARAYADSRVPGGDA
ncbi:MAG: small multi-drug export protein [Planctomycetota bacterium]